MGQKYRQLCETERFRLAELQAKGFSIRQIAAALDRAPSSIARELKRNRQAKDYGPGQAQLKAKARRWKGSKLDRNTTLRASVLGAMANGLSPEQVAGRMRLEAGKTVIGHETIYRFIYAQITRHNDFSWRAFLPRAKFRRGRRGKRGGSPANFIQNRQSIALRPSEAGSRKSFGHWEGDLMLFAKYGQAVLTLHERKSRILIGHRPANKSAALIAGLLHSLLAPLPEPLRQTITFDNGTEFAQHSRLHALQLQTFFCDTHSPWQKGGIENAIGRMRRFLPRKADLATLADDDFNAFLAAYNNTPRKCLDFRTPAEVFLTQLLHFEWESTFPLSRE